MPNGPEGKRRQADRSECAVPACRIAIGDGRAACELPEHEKALVRRCRRAGAGTAAGWGVTGLLVLSLGSAAHAQAPSPSEEEAVAEAVAALRELPAEPGLPESAEAAEAQDRERVKVSLHGEAAHLAYRMTDGDACERLMPVLEGAEYAIRLDVNIEHSGSTAEDRYYAAVWDRRSSELIFVAEDRGPHDAVEAACRMVLADAAITR